MLQLEGGGGNRGYFVIYIFLRFAYITYFLLLRKQLDSQALYVCIYSRPLGQRQYTEKHSLIDSRFIMVSEHETIL